MLNLTDFSEAFPELLRVFANASHLPFSKIEYRAAYKKGQRCTSFDNLLKKQQGLPYNPGKLLPDESEYIAVITLSAEFSSSVLPYVFKVRPDGDLVYDMTFQYVKQPICKWLKLITRFVDSLPCFRQVNRTMAFKHELLQKTLDFFLFTMFRNGKFCVC